MFRLWWQNVDGGKNAVAWIFFSIESTLSDLRKFQLSFEMKILKYKIKLFDDWSPYTSPRPDNTLKMYENPTFMHFKLVFWSGEPTGFVFFLFEFPFCMVECGGGGSKLLDSKVGQGGFDR